MTKEKENIDGEEIEIYYFSNPMYHEDWHKVEELGLAYIQYNHHGPDYWDDTLSFCKKDKVEKVKTFYEEQIW